MFLEIIYILSFIVTPLIVIGLRVELIKSKIVISLISLIGLLFFLESFEFILLNTIIHNIIVLSLYITLWSIVVSQYTKFIKYKPYKIIFVGFIMFFHIVLSIIMLFNHAILAINNPIRIPIDDNIYAIEIRNGGAWADENMVKVQILQSFGFVSIMLFTESFPDSEVQYMYDNTGQSLHISMRNPDSGNLYKVATISL